MTGENRPISACYYLIKNLFIILNIKTEAHAFLKALFTYKYPDATSSQ